MAENRPFTVANVVQIGLLVATLVMAWIAWHGYEASQIAARDVAMEIAKKESAQTQVVLDAISRIEEQQARQAAATEKRADEIRQDLISGREARNAEISHNEARRDMSDRQAIDAINRLTDRVNRLSDQITSRSPHSELFEPLPPIAQR